MGSNPTPGALTNARPARAFGHLGYQSEYQPVTSDVGVTLEVMPRHVLDPGPFRFTEIHGPHRSYNERFQVGRLLRQYGYAPPRCAFALLEIPLTDLIESLLLQAHQAGDAAFDYDTWKINGAPEATLRAEFAGSTEAARVRRPPYSSVMGQDSRRMGCSRAKLANLGV